jgi:hypothetical protein
VLLWSTRIGQSPGIALAGPIEPTRYQPNAAGGDQSASVGFELNKKRPGGTTLAALTPAPAAEPKLAAAE